MRRSRPSSQRRAMPAGALAACTFVCAAFVAFQVYDAACSQTDLVDRTRHAHERTAALATARALESAVAIAAPSGAPVTAALVDSLLPAALDRHPPLTPAELGADAGSLAPGPLVVVTLLDPRGRPTGGGTVSNPPGARVPLAGALDGWTAVVALHPRAVAALDRRAWSWNHAQLAIALVTVTATLIVATLLQLRRERAAARLRSDFVSGVSHELRTPLAQIRMFSEMLRLGWVRSDEERDRAVAVIDQEARRLTGLVENVLQLSRAERGGGSARVAAAPVAVAPFVEEVVSTFALLARSRAADVRVDAVDPDLTVAADRDALRQALLNLLDNAVKYGPRGQTVRVGADRAGDGTLVHLWVADEGPGIPPLDRDRARIWEPFERLQRDVDAGVAGNGIGLTVVRALARAHGGRAFVADAAPGTRGTGGPRGARFVLELPAASEPPRPTPRPARHVPMMARG